MSRKRGGFSTVKRFRSHRRVPTVGPPSRFGVLASLGIHGCGAIEDAYLAGLALGEPILLVGGIGSAKTLLAERTAQALGLRFWAYDASKAVFEDVMGFPDPRAMQEGRVDYLPAPLTLWGKEFILVDELSRAVPGMQNKWLEVIRSRRLMGMPLPDLQYIVAAMNPVGLLGTMPLDPALAGRFPFILSLPDVNVMDEEDRRRVIRNTTEADAHGLRRTAAAQESGPDVPALSSLIERTRALYPGIEQQWGETVVTYLDHVRQHLLARDLALDGRRLGMMRRALLAMLALREVTGRTAERHDAPPFEAFRAALDHTLPFEAQGEGVPRLVLNTAHNHAVSVLKGRRRMPLVGPHFLDQVEDWLKDEEAASDRAASSLLVTRIASALEHPKKPEVATEAAAALFRLMAHPETHARLSADTRHRLWTSWKSLSSLGPHQVGEFSDRSSAVEVEDEVPERVRTAVLRMAFRLSERLDRLPSIHCPFEDFAAGLLDVLVEGGDA